MNDTTKVVHLSALTPISPQDQDTRPEEGDTKQYWSVR